MPTASPRHPFMTVPKPRNHIHSPRPESMYHARSALEHHATMFNPAFVPPPSMIRQQNSAKPIHFPYDHRGPYSTPPSQGCDIVRSIFISPLMRCTKRQHCIPSQKTSSRQKLTKAYPMEYQPSKTTTASPEKTLIWTIRDTDVLCGRGSGSGHKHLGNARFLELIAAQSFNYRTLTKKQKLHVATQIVHLVRKSGHFLARDSKTGGWYDIGLPRSIEKASQALREQNALSDETRQPFASDENSSHDLSAASPTCSESTTKWNNQTSAVRSSNTMPNLIVPPALLTVYRYSKKPSKTTAAADSSLHNRFQSSPKSPGSDSTGTKPRRTPLPQTQFYLEEVRDGPASHRNTEIDDTLQLNPKQGREKPLTLDGHTSLEETVLRTKGSLMDTSSEVDSSSMSSLSSCEDIIVESKLSLEDRIIRAPQGMNERNLVPPSQVQYSRQHDSFVMEQGCLVALSTAAFLRL